MIQLPGIYAKEKTKWIPVFRAIGAMTNIVLNIFLIPKYGVIGSAWATAISFFIMSLSVFIKLFNIYYIKYNWLALCYPLLFMSVILFPVESLFYRFLIVMFYVFGWYFLVITKNERIILKSLFQ